MKLLPVEGERERKYGISDFSRVQLEKFFRLSFNFQQFSINNPAIESRQEFLLISFQAKLILLLQNVSFKLEVELN